MHPPAVHRLVCGRPAQVLEVQLWRADAVTAVVELDKRLAVSRTDPAAGLLFGLPHKLLLKKSFAA